LDLEYGETIDAEDEVEDLYELLKEVKVSEFLLENSVDILDFFS
jgi:hypothetical protein